MLALDHGWVAEGQAGMGTIAVRFGLRGGSRSNAPEYKGMKERGQILWLIIIFV